MKLKTLLVLGTSALMLITSLCSCQTPADSETETQTESLTLKIEENTETEAPPQTLEELVDRILPPLDVAEDPNWEKKLLSTGNNMTHVYEGPLHDNGKYMVCLTLSISVSETIVSDMMEARYQFDGTKINEAQSKLLCIKRQMERFTEYYVTDTKDILLNDSYTFITYASREEIEKYAKCKLVSAIISGDEVLESLSQPKTEH